MEDFSRLDELSKIMANRAYMINKRKKLVDELAKLSQEEIRLQSSLKKETEDYHAMEKLSIKKLIALFSNHYEEMLDREFREMKMAQYKYDNLLETLTQYQVEIKGITDALKKTEYLEQEYTTLLNAKIAWVNQQGNQEIMDFDQKIRNCESKKKEIEEAIQASKKLISVLRSTAEELSTSKGWGTWDIFGGGMLTSLVKHDHLNRASQLIKDSQDKANALTQELSDLNYYFDFDLLDLDSLTVAFDTFFDNIFSDLSVQSQIAKASDNIHLNLEKAERLLEKLEVLLVECQSTIQELTQKRNEAILRL